MILGANADAAALALELVMAGVGVAALVMLENSPFAPDAAETARLQAAKVEILTGAIPVEAHADDSGALATLTVSQPRGARRLECDALLMSVGYAPAQHLALQAGAADVP